MFYASRHRRGRAAAGGPFRLATGGTWTTARPLRFPDLVDVDIPSLFDLVGKTLRPWLLFLHDFAAAVSRPLSRGEEAVHYVPTQVFTEYVRQCARRLRSRSGASGTVRRCAAKASRLR